MFNPAFHAYGCRFAFAGRIASLLHHAMEFPLGNAVSRYAYVQFMCNGNGNSNSNSNGSGG